MQNDKEVERKAIEKYGEEVGLIYMVGYLEGKTEGLRDAVGTFEDFDKGTISVPKKVDMESMGIG